MIWLEEDKAQEIIVGPFVDFSDGVTPETGIAAVGAPGWDDSSILWTKWVGGVPTTEAITAVGSGGDNEITELSDGFYRIKLTATNVDTPGPARISFRDEDFYGPVWHDITVQTANVFQWNILGTATLTDIATVLSRIGAFTGSGVNSILGFFRSVMRKDLVAPSDVGGTFDPTSDSTEAIRDKIQRIAGSSSLPSIEAKVNVLAEGATAGAPRTTGGTTTTGARSGGYLDRVFRVARRATDEPSTLSKYTESDLLDLMTAAWPQIWSDLKLTADNTPIVEFDVEVNSTDVRYELPANVGEIRRLAKINTETGGVEWEAYPLGTYNPRGYGYRLTGNVVQFSGKWGDSHTLRLEYVPSGEIFVHEGGGAKTFPVTEPPVVEVTQLKIDFQSEFLVGTVDRRPNAYAGQFIRIFEGDEVTGVVQERLITASTSEGLLTFAAPVTGGAKRVRYEIIPVQGVLLESLLGLNMARRIHINEGNKNGFQLVTAQYAEDLRAVQLRLSTMMARRAHHHEGDAVENRHYGRRR